jgi:hypothetical protein
MAYLISEKLLKKYEERFIIKLKIRYWRVISKFRKILRFIKKPLYNKFYSNNINFKIEIINEKNFLENSSFYKQNHYCFIENILDESFYSNLRKNFPPVDFFLPPRHVSKFYNFGFKWVQSASESDLKTDYFFEINHFFKVLKSAYFLDMLNLFVNDGRSRLLYSFNLTLANKGAILLPHKDSITNFEEKTTLVKKETALNMIFFIKGKRNSDGNIGGTGIYLDNEFKKSIFIPRNLNNSLLIYRSDANLFHGFDEMEENSERFTVNAQFSKV